jgi:hypothetical protein
MMMNAAKRGVTKSTELQRESQRLSLIFLNAQLDTALRCTEFAIGAQSGSEEGYHSRFAANRAYDEVIRLKSRWPRSGAETQELEQRLIEVKSALERLGKTL